MIYFIQQGFDGLIKIGKADDVSSRLSQLQVGSGSKLRLLLQIKGGHEKESEIHKKFKQYRIRGEWFLPSKEILNYISDVSIEHRASQVMINNQEKDVVLFNDFLSRFCCEGVELRDEATNLWKAYRQWKSETKHPENLKRNTFYKELRLLGFQQKVGTGNKLYFYGIKALPLSRQHSYYHAEAFKKWSHCKNIYQLSGQRQGILKELLGYGFIADCAYAWGVRDLATHDLVIVSRTYAYKELIDTPMLGLLVVRLPSYVLGDRSKGTVIATAINGISDISEQCLNLYADIPIKRIISALHLGMSRDYGVMVSQGDETGKLTFVKKG